MSELLLQIIPPPKGDVDERPSAPVPVQRNNHRYLPGEPIKWIEGDYFIRKVCPPTMGLSQHDRCRSIIPTGTSHLNTFYTATGAKFGYRSILGSEGALEGDWYFEAVFSGSSESHLRIGIARVGADLLSPIGVDKFGFCFCDTGHRMHSGKKEEWGEAFSAGDIIGVRLRQVEIPKEESIKFLLNPPKRVDVKYHGIYLEEKIYQDDDDEPSLIDSNNGKSFLEIYKNGKSLGIIFKNLPIGVYYPAFSLYNSPQLHVNFGPQFVFPAPIESKPFSDSIKVSLVANSLIDLKTVLLSNKSFSII